MISIGTDIRSSSDKLSNISIREVFDRIWMPGNDLEQKVNQLRRMRQIDMSSYKEHKKELPYVVCGIFNPPYRKIENFCYTEYFVIDIDNLSSKGLSAENLKESLKHDERVVMSFVSPSDDGLKVVFRLRNRCYDSGLYSIFYKSFARKLSEQYNLEQAIDSKTSDVSRACFLSWDPNAYYNANAEAVDLSAYADTSNPMQLFDEKREQEKTEKENPAASAASMQADPDEEAMNKIKALLNPKYTSVIQQKKQIYVPEILEDIMEKLKSYMSEIGLELYEVIDINYGKKLRMRMGNRNSEINLFYGKRGFSVVISPRNGTDEELNDLSEKAVIMFLNTKMH